MSFSPATDVRRPATRRRYESRAIDSFLDLNEGDLVVHVNHGIARYRGLQLVKRGDEHEEETLPPGVRRGDQAVRPDRQDRPCPEVRRRRQRGARALQDRVVLLGEAEEAGGRGGGRPRRRADRHPGRSGEPAGDRLSRAEDSRWMAEFEAAFPLPGDARPALRRSTSIKRDMAQPSADGPPDLRRRLLRQDRGRHPRGVQGGRRGEAGRGPGANHDPRRAASAGASPRGWPSSPSRDRGCEPVPPQVGGQASPEAKAKPPVAWTC